MKSFASSETGAGLVGQVCGVKAWGARVWGEVCGVEVWAWECEVEAWVCVWVCGEVWAWVRVGWKCGLRCLPPQLTVPEDVVQG